MKIHPGYNTEDLKEFTISKAYMFPVQSGLYTYVDTPDGYTDTYNIESDGWCVAWMELERWEKNELHKHTQTRDRWQWYKDKQDAINLKARLLMGIPPEED